MSVHFFTEREFPSELRQLGGYGAYGDGEAAAVSDIFGHLTSGAVGITEAVSPWGFLTGIFVDKPKAEAAGQVAQAEITARVIAQQQQQRQETLRTVLLVGAGLVAVVVIVSATRPRKPKPVAGYRKQRRAR
jgi:hypothetical protein